MYFTFSLRWVFVVVVWSCNVVWMSFYVWELDSCGSYMVCGILKISCLTLKYILFICCVFYFFTYLIFSILKENYFSWSCLLCFGTVVCRGFWFVFNLCPPIFLLVRYCIYNVLMSCFCYVLFHFLLIFYNIISCHYFVV